MRASSSTAIVLSRLAMLYLAGLLAWAVVWLTLGDRWWWLFAVNALALYLFVPLPVVALAAVLARGRALAAGFALGALLWIYLWGSLFSGGPSDPPGEAPVLRVMTYNVLGYNEDAGVVIATILEADADLVGFQELNPRIAAAIRDRLSERYPFQSLEPREGVSGGGVISRIPFQRRSETIADADWIGDPMMIDLEFGEGTVTVVFFHAAAGVKYHEARERQARKLAGFARGTDGPLILMGDLNASSTNRAYRTVAGALDDGWREAGSGFGHTFPGASGAITPGSSRLHLFGLPVPRWLVRIDYVFYSGHWQAVSARTGPFDKRSDHRPLVVELALVR